MFPAGGDGAEFRINGRVIDMGGLFPHTHVQTGKMTFPHSQRSSFGTGSVTDGRRDQER